MTQLIICKTCHGKGMVGQALCDRCFGDGMTVADDEITDLRKRIERLEALKDKP